MNASLRSADDDERRLLIEAASNAMLVIDAGGMIALANAEAERFLGYERGTLAGHPADVLKCPQIGAAATLGADDERRDPVAHATRTVRRGDGTVLPVIVSSRRFTSADGPHELITLWDRNMYVLYGIEDATTPPTFDMWKATIHPHDRDRAVSEIKTDFADDKPSDSEFRIVWPNGDVRYVRSLATIVVDAAGSPARVVGTDWDITEIRSLGEALREEKDALVSSEARYRALTEAMPQMVWVIDDAAHVEYVNWRWISYTGMPRERCRSVGISGIIDPARRRDHQCALRRHAGR